MMQMGGRFNVVGDGGSILFSGFFSECTEFVTNAQVRAARRGRRVMHPRLERA